MQGCRRLIEVPGTGREGNEQPSVVELGKNSSVQPSKGSIRRLSLPLVKKGCDPDRLRPDLSLGYAVHVYKGQGITAEASGILAGRLASTETAISTPDLGSNSRSVSAYSRVRCPGRRHASAYRGQTPRRGHRARSAPNSADRHRPLDGPAQPQVESRRRACNATQGTENGHELAMGRCCWPARCPLFASEPGAPCERHGPALRRSAISLPVEL